MRVYLANPPWTEEGKDDRYGVRAGSRWPHFEDSISSYCPFPFFLAYTAALLERNTITVRLRDSIAEKDSLPVFLNDVASFRPDLIIIETSTPSIHSDLDLCRTLGNRWPDLKIALAGPHSEMFTPAFMSDHSGIFAVLIGEYEHIALELAQALESGQSLDSVAGLIYRHGDSVVCTPARSLIENLDELPFPARHLLNMDQYQDLFCELPGPSLQIIASRGCPFQCIFCSWPQVMYGSHRYRVRSAANILDEIEQSLERYNIRSIYFDDDTFNIGEQRVIDIANEFLRRGIHVPWAVMARADTMTEAMLRRMKAAGLAAVKYGIESTTQSILDRAKKKLDLRKAEEVIGLTRSLGIKVHLTFCFGLPGETKDTINQTIDDAIRLNPDSVQFSIVTPYPGSEYFDTLDREGRILTKDWREYDGGSQAVFETDTLSRADLAEALRVAYLRWQMHSLRKSFFRRFFFFFSEAVRHPVRSMHYLWKMAFAPKHV
ncbi:MAG TPA: radical SAM protein [Acidobacteriota bacterium]|nr:radical SAM protein [Acidobacteriota bacterium]HQG92706.1 radical SAM protein [Acidobacteriota bacterium]